MASFFISGSLVAQTTFAQIEDKDERKTADYPHAFIGIRGGGQVTYTDFKSSKLITPVAAIDVGGMFTPVVGGRINVSGIDAKGGVKSINKTYSYNFITTNIDLLINLCEAFAPHKNHTLNAYLLGGVGLGYAWNNGELNDLVKTAEESNLNLRWDKNRLVHNLRIGLQLEAELSRNVGVSMEVSANNLHDRFNSKINGKGDWQLQTTLGLNFKFGHKGKISTPVPVLPIVREIPKVVAEMPKLESTSSLTPLSMEKQLAKEEKIRIDIFFVINSATPSRKEELKVRELADWLKSHPKIKVDLTGYADAGTGNASINRTISARRVKNIARLLTKKYGIAASRITTCFKGDTVQPFLENDANRVVIGISRDDVKY